MESKGVLIYIALVFLFPLFYLFVPIVLGFILNVIIIVIAFIYFWGEGKEERRLIFVVILFFTLNSYFLFRYFSTLQMYSLTLTLDPIEYLRFASLGLVISTYIRYLPFMILFFVAFGFLYAWSFIQTRGASSYKFAIIIGYIGVIIVLLLIFLDMFTFSPNANIEEETFEIDWFGDMILFPFNMYYFMQISVWYISTFSFMVSFLGHLAG